MEAGKRYQREKRLLLITCQVLLDKTSVERKKGDMSSISGGPQEFTKTPL